MDPAEILNQQCQQDFETDLLNALNVAGTLNPQVVTELGKLSNKKTFFGNRAQKGLGR